MGGARIFTDTTSGRVKDEASCLQRRSLVIEIYVYASCIILNLIYNRIF